MSYTQFPARFGKYILLDRINSGGMAEVFRAKVTGAESFQRLVAIKCMLPQLNEDQQFTTMFIDEAKLAAQLSHANIVQIYELGRINEHLYIAMELVNGRDLRHIIKRATAAQMPVPMGFAAYVIARAAEALDFAHRKTGMDGRPLNLVHRDVSPQNILVSFDGEVKVVDFGIAKAEVRDTETRAGVLKGKFAYMAPEQVMGSGIDRRADVFALGTVLYETLTGKKLFRGESDFSILEKVRAAEVPSVAAQIAGVPAEIDTILQRALARDLEQRYPWASDLAEDMAPLLIDQRTIFGTKQARQFMAALYTDDIAELDEQLRRYAAINTDDCVETSTQKKEPKDAEVFESDFSTLDQPLSDLVGDAGNPPTQLSERREAPVPAPQPPESSEVDQDWAELDSSGGFGRKLAEPGTLLFEGSGKRVPARDLGAAVTAEQPALTPIPVPVPLERMASAPASGLRPGMAGSVGSGVVLTPQPAPSMAKPVLVGLLVATALVSVAVVAVVVTRPKPATVVVPMVMPVEVPSASAQPAASPTVTVGSATEPTAATAPEPSTPAVEPSTPDTGDAVEDAEEADKPGKGKKPAGKFGYITVKAEGVKAAKVFVDNKEVGYSPLVFHRVRTGKHRIKVVEDGGARSKILDVVVAPGNTRKDPLKLLVNL